MKALFFRKCPNQSKYIKLSSEYPELGQKLDFKVINIIKFLEYDNYLEFVNNFFKDDENIKKITSNLYMDSNDKVYCALFTWRNEEGYLVYPCGYNYARYVAKWNNKMGYGDKND